MVVVHANVAAAAAAYAAVYCQACQNCLTQLRDQSRAASRLCTARKHTRAAMPW